MGSPQQLRNAAEKPQSRKSPDTALRPLTLPKARARGLGGAGSGRSPTKGAIGARVQMVSPRTAWAQMGMSPPGSPLSSPGSSPGGRRSRRRHQDPRKKILLRMTYLNLFLGAIMIVLHFLGPKYPGHYGTTNEKYLGRRRLITVDSPIYADECPSSEVTEANDSILNSGLIAGIVIWVLQPVAAFSISGQMGQQGTMCQLISSTMSALTCAGAFVVILLDMDYITDCCSQLEDNCEVSDLCTEISDSCCIGTPAMSYCDDPAYQLCAAMMIFVVFIFTLAQAIMSCTIGCKCWVNADPEKQALMMVVSSSPRFSPRGGSPTWSPRRKLVPGASANLGGSPITSRTPPLTAASATTAATGGPSGVSRSGAEQAEAEPAQRRRKGSVYFPEDSELVPAPTAPVLLRGEENMLSTEREERGRGV